MTTKRDLDLVVFGATGYTGRLVVEHLVRRTAGSDVRWAIGGRSEERLAAMRTEIGAPDVPIVVADTSDLRSLERLAARTRCVLTTVGPYQRYGSALVEACVRAGTDYVDLCGEPAWMRTMIDQHSASSTRTGARVLFSCGFDSLPSELGVWLCQAVAVETLGGPVPRVRGRVRSFVGGPSGGTVATMIATAQAAQQDERTAALLSDPFALTPGFDGPAQPSTAEARDDPDVGPVVSFMLGDANRMTVHRSNQLLNHRYGTGFVYDEMILAAAAPPEPSPSAPSTPPPPSPGEGPTAAQREAGSFELLFIGSSDAGQVEVTVSGEQDPGYGCTSQMVTETALCLLDSPDVRGGLWTPVAALGGRLADRLRKHTSLSFS